MPDGPTSPAKTDEFSRVYRAEIDYVCKSLRRLGVEARHVEDLGHDVFISAFQSFERYDRARPIRPWLFAIAFHRVSAFHLRAHHRNELETAAPELGDGQTPADEGLAARQLVLRGLDALDLDKRAVLVMHDVDGCAAPEVALSLGVPLNTVYSRLRKARSLFEAEVRKLQGAA